ncbi:DUF3841 domain-containing protein [Methylobacterium sp. JK268]
MDPRVCFPRRHRLRAKGPADLVRVYSFQSLAAASCARERGFWAGDRRFVDEHFAVPYAWMVDQMSRRIPDFSGDYPIWGYFVRPNMRRCRFDDDCVLVVADVPRSRMLISDLARWHNPLNLLYCFDSEDEEQALVDAGIQLYASDRVATPAMMESWGRVFDIAERSSDRAAAAGRLISLQACIDRIYPHEVVRLSLATGRLGRKGGQLI